MGKSGKPGLQAVQGEPGNPGDITLRQAGDEARQQFGRSGALRIRGLPIGQGPKSGVGHGRSTSWMTAGSSPA
ncbi:hypothetical protein XAR_3749 [Xanthomonas citri pv. glycines str. 8ra]|nr:hypothetical protein XAR_3749 [Xanthomonas citri pv. glycines str. 8ra]